MHLDTSAFKKRPKSKLDLSAFGFAPPEEAEVQPEPVRRPRGFLRTIFKEIKPTIKRTAFDFFQRERERQERQTLKEEAVTELIERPARILKFATFDFPRLIAGGLSEAGKTIQEFVATPFVGSERAQKLVKATPLEEKIFGFKPQSFADYTEGIQKFLDKNPDATETEKKVLPLAIPFVLLGLEFTGFGGVARRLPQKLLTDIAKSGNLDEIFKIIKPSIKGSDEDIRKLAEGLVKLQNPKDIDAILKAGVKGIDTTAFKVPEVPAPVVLKELQPLIEEVRKFDTAEDFTKIITKTDEGIPAVKLDVSLDDIVSGQPITIGRAGVKKDLSKIIIKPIDVSFNIDNGKFTIIDGHHRFLQARANELKKIPARVTFTKDIEEGGKFIRTENLVTQSQLTDFFNAIKQESERKSKLGEVFQAQEIKDQRILHKSLTEEGRVLLDGSGKQVFPIPIKENPTPLKNPIVITEVEKAVGKVIDKQVKKGRKALENVGNKRGNTDKIIEKLRSSGVSESEINNIFLENGDRLIDTVKVKREANGVLSATITKQELEDIEKGFKGTDLIDKWIPTKTALQKAKELGRNSKAAALDYYELPQLFFDRTGLRKQFYDPIRQAERNAQDMKTAVYKQFEGAELLNKGGWFTPERFDLSKKQAEDIGEYYLTRQDKGGNVALKDLDKKSQEFVKIFDQFISDSEERFFRVSALNGKSPGKVPNYAPIMTNEDFKLAREAGDLDFIFRKHPAFFSLKKRAEEVPFEMFELDYRKVATRWIDQISNFNHLGEVGPEVKYLANSEEFKDLVGDEVFKTTNKWLQDTFNPQVLSPVEKVGRFARQKAAIASLGLNIASVLKQVLTQVPLTIIEKAPPKLESKFAKALNIKVKDLPSIKERKGNASIMDMQEGLNKAFVGPLSEFDKFNAEKSLNRLIDKEAAKIVNIDELLRGEITISPEIQVQVLKKAQDTLDMWFGGMTRSQLPKAFRTELGKLINMFIMPLTSQLNGFFFSIAKAEGLKKPQKVAEVLASAVTIAYLEQVITNLDVKWSDSVEMSKDVLGSLAGNIPIISQIVFAIRTDQPLGVSPAISSVSRLVQQISKSMKDQATAGDVALAIAEMFGLPKQARRTIQGAKIVKDGGLRDKSGKLLAPVTGTGEQIRAFLRGKYGTIATQDWIRNIGIKSEQRKWFVPEVEFLQNGDWVRRMEITEQLGEKQVAPLVAEMGGSAQKDFKRWNFARTNPVATKFELGQHLKKQGLDKDGRASTAQFESHKKKVAAINELPFRESKPKEQILEDIFK